MLVPYDHPTMEYTKKIGFEPKVIEGGFDGFLIVKAHAGSGTIVPGTNKTTGDLEEEAQEREADADFAHHHRETAHNQHNHEHTHKHETYELNGVLHRADGTHSHDGGHTWHTH